MKVLSPLVLCLGSMSHAFLVPTPCHTSTTRSMASSPQEPASTTPRPAFALPSKVVQAGLAIALAIPSLFSSPTPAVASADLKAQLEALNKQVLLQEKLLKMSRDSKRIDFPVVQGGNRVAPEEMSNAIERIKVLSAYLDEVERDIFRREWKYVGGFLGVFAEQEDAFVKLIEGLYPTKSKADSSSREALSYEAQRMFLEVDNLVEAAKYQRPRSAERAYANIALAYDRFLKAGDLYSAYDPITSTEPFYANIPGRAIQYDVNATPQVKDLIVVLGGPDKGKTGKMIAVDENNKAVVKLDTNGRFTEVKIIKMVDVGKQLDQDS